MSYLLLIVWPWAMAGGCWLLRRTTPVATQLAALALLGEGLLLLRAPLAEPLRLLGANLLLSSDGRLLFALVVAATLVNVILNSTSAQGSHLPGISLLLVGCGGAIMLFATPLIGSIFWLVVGTLNLSVVADVVIDSPRLLSTDAVRNAIRALILVVIGTVLLFVGLIFGDGAAAPAWASLLVVVGLTLLFGLIPFYFVLTTISSASSWEANGLLRGGFLPLGLLLLLAIIDSQMLTDHSQQLLQVIGTITSLGLSLLALRYPLTQRFMLLLHAQFALLVVQLGASTGTALPSALTPATGHMLAVSLIIVSLSLLERHVAGRRETQPLWRARLLGAVGLVVGVLATLGLLPIGRAFPLVVLLHALHPMSLGFTIGIVALIVMAYVAIRTVYALLLRPPSTTYLPLPPKISLLPASVPQYAPFTIRLVLVVLIMVSVFGGFSPPQVFTLFDPW